MNRDILLKECLPDTICLNPIGENAAEIWTEQFETMYRKFFDSVMEIQKADISDFPGYGELDENNKPQYATFQEYLVDTFADDYDDYWNNWKELFETSMMTKEFFEKYYNKMLEYSKYCENQRFLVNNHLFFGNMVIMENSVGFLDWERMAITDWLMDFAGMDLHRPFFKIPEKLYAYLLEKGIKVEHFKERFLCRAYFKGLDVLPPELITQIQKYAAGKLLYIPQKEEPKAWGSISGFRQKLLQRNQRIYNEFIEGKGIGQLAEEYFLSVDSIKKIVYGKKQRWIPFHPTLDSAMEYNEAGLAEEWLRTYFTKKYGENTYPEQWICDGLVKIPLRLITTVDTANSRKLAQYCDVLILLYKDGQLVYDGDGKFLEQLKAQHRNSYPAYIFVTDKDEYATYVNKYGKHFHQAKI